VEQSETAGHNQRHDKVSLTGVILLRAVEGGRLFDTAVSTLGFDSV
jgi:hypothetical protein